MFWMGYLYRYISYTGETSTRLIMKLFPFRQMNDLYYSNHTRDPEWCIQNLPDLNHLTEDIFDNNFRLKEAIRSKKQIQLVCPS